MDALLERAERSGGHPPLSEPSRLTWADRASNHLGLVLRDGGRIVATAHLVHRDGAWNVEIVDPSDRGSAARRSLLAAAATLALEHGASEVRYWAYEHRPDDDDVPLELGFTVERDLLQMRVALPLAVARKPLDGRFELRAFRPGEDEAAWLEVNNRAFLDHPEQSHWDLPTLLARERTEWFDPEGFLVCESEGRLAGSCWTKVHARRDPALGEIYVISVDPDFQAHGLGKVLAIAGLDWLAGRVGTGMLYVEKDNAKAVELYRSLGFAADHVDRCYLLRRPL